MTGLSGHNGLGGGRRRIVRNGVLSASWRDQICLFLDLLQLVHKISIPGRA